jgi:hypothetical protein
MERPAEPEPTNVVSLMDALRQSAGAGAKAPAKKKAASSKAERGAGKKAPTRKAASKRAAAAEPRRRKAS